MARADITKDVSKETAVHDVPTQARASALLKRHALFFIFVVIPTLAATLYFGVFASDVYISESKFVVKSPERPSVTGLGSLLSGAGFANANEELYGAQTFASSRDALRLINKGQAYRKAYTRPTISAFNRFDPLG